MRVVCNTVSDFLLNLESEGAERVLQGVVRISVLSTPIGGNKKDAVKFEVVLQASAVVGLVEGGEYLLEVGIDCGIDYMDASHEFEGTRVAEVAKRQIEVHCEKSGLEVRPGIIDL